jgi:probable selenium-dependent hydroxylase accessory protein YqeC
MGLITRSMALKKGGVISLVGAGGKTSLMFRIAHELSRRGDPVLTTTTTRIMMPTTGESPHVILSSCPSAVVAKAKALLKKSPHITAVSKKNDEKLAGFSLEVINTLWKTRLFKWILVEADGAAHMPLKAPDFFEPVIPECTNRLIGVIGLDAVGKPSKEPFVFRSHIYARLTGLCIGSTITAESVAKVILHEKGIMKGCPESAKRIAFLNKADYPGALATGKRIAAILEKKGKGFIQRIIIGTVLNAPEIKKVITI